MAADQVEAGALLQKLRTLKAQAFLTEDASGIPRYLAKPALRVTVTDDGGRATTVLLAPSAERRGDQPSAYAAVAERGPLVLVSGSALDDLGRTANDLRDRRLLGSLEPKDVQRVTVKRGGKTAVLERKGEGEWRMVEPTKGAAKSGKVDDLLYTARALKWKDVVAPRGEDPGRYGLDTPELEIALGAAMAARSARSSWASARAIASSCAPRPLPPFTPWSRASSATFPTCPTTSRGRAMTAPAEHAIYLRQMELGPMQNFVYLVGDPVARHAWWWIRVGDRDDRRRRSGTAWPSSARSSPTPIRTTWGKPRVLGHARAHPGRRGVARARAPQGLCPQGGARIPQGLWLDLVKVDGHDTLAVGRLTLTFLHTPGHTPGSQCFLVDGRLVSGDTLFIGACGRTDLPGSDPTEMYYSLTQRLAALPDETILLPGHNYGGASSTIGDEKHHNAFMRIGSLGDFLRTMGGGAWAGDVGRVLAPSTRL